MMMFYAQQDTFGGTACGASFAARTAMFSLIILGTALAVSLFILLDPVVLALSVRPAGYRYGPELGSFCTSAE